MYIHVPVIKFYEGDNFRITEPSSPPLRENGTALPVPNN